MKAVLIPTDSAPEVVDLAPGYESLRNAVGGYIQAIYPEVLDSLLYINEEGKLLNLPENQNREALAALNLRGMPQDTVIVGNALVVGTDEDGELVDVPQAILDALGL